MSARLDELPFRLRMQAERWRAISTTLTPDADGLEDTSRASIRTAKRIHEEHAAEIDAILKALDE